MEDRKLWISILFVGVLFQLIAASLMPIGLDGHIHINYVTDDMADGDASLDWGKVRNDGTEFSTPESIESDDKWKVWHGIIELWFKIFGISLASIHILSFLISMGCLGIIFLLTKKLWGIDNALALTAISSIYSPLIRASGRFYQENMILLLATVTIFSLMKMRRNQKPTTWALVGFISLAAMLSIKGLNTGYSIVLFTPVALWAVKKIELKPMNIPVLLTSCLFASAFATWARTGNIDIDLLNFLLRTLLIGGGIYLLIATLFFASNNDSSTPESDFLSLLSQLVFIALTAYIVMLLSVEKISLGISVNLTAQQFSYIFRYMTVLIVPLWWSYMARSEKNIIKFRNNPKKYAMVYAIILMMFLNVTMLQTTGGMERVGEEISDEIEIDDNILYISEPYHSMHRLYTLQVTLDPKHDMNVTGYWAHHDYNWSHIISDSDIDWVIFTDKWDSYLSSDWQLFETDTDYIIYHKKSSS